MSDKTYLVFKAILNQLESVIKEHGETKLIRVNLIDFGDLLWPKGVELFQFMMKLRKLTSDRNVVTFITVPRTLESALCQFSDSQFKMSNFVVNQSHFKSIYDGIIDLTKMVQGNDSFFSGFLCQVQKEEFLEDFELEYFFPFGKNGPHENYVIYSRPFSIFCIMFAIVLKLFIIRDAENTENIIEKKTKTINES